MFMWTGHFYHHDKNKRGDNRNDDHCTQHDTKLTPLPTDKFKAVPSLNRELSDAVSFQYSKRNGWYVTCKNRLCHIEPKRRTMNFERQSSFFPLLNLWYDGFTVFESTTKAGFYLRSTQYRLVLEQYDGTEKFKQEASFKTHRAIGSDLKENDKKSNNPNTEEANNNYNIIISNNNHDTYETSSATSSPLLFPCCSDVNNSNNSNNSNTSNNPLVEEEDGGFITLSITSSLSSLATSPLLVDGQQRRSHVN